MPNPLTRTLRAYATDARTAFRNAPVEVALGIVLALAFSVDARKPSFPSTDFARLGASVVLAFPLVFALSILVARGLVRPAARWAGTIAVLAAAALLGRFGLHGERGGEWWRWVLLAAAAVLLLAMTGGLPWRDGDRRRGWAFAWRLALRVVGISLYSVALYAVLAGAVAAVVSLFEMKGPEHLYTDLMGWVFFAFAPWILVGGIERLTAPAPDGVPEAVSRLGRWLYAPVLVIYLAVLYAYAVKVVATGELPKNLVSPLVIAAGVIGLLGAVLLHPVHDDDAHRGVSLLARAVPALLLPLVPLALWALGARLGEYGWTEFRYVRTAAVAAIGIVAVLGTVRLLRRRPPLLGTIPAVFAAVLLLSAIGPWSAPAVSRRDQGARLRAELRRAGLDPRRPPADTVTVDSAAYGRIDSGMRYLLDAHGIAALRAVMPVVPDTARSTWRMLDRLGVRRGCGSPAWAWSDLQWEAGVTGVLGGTLAPLEAAEGRPDTVPAGALQLRASVGNDRLRVDAGPWSAEADLVPLRTQLLRRPGGCLGVEERDGPVGHPPGEALLVLRDAAGAARAQVVVTHYVVSAPIERSAQTQQPGVHVREVRGFVVVP